MGTAVTIGGIGIAAFAATIFLVFLIGLVYELILRRRAK